ncbi:MAG: glycerophosphoryl diester phosphodiesterase [Nocardioidaceae bacterium]|jgi:glycerophosphoryl diester phosphodiesterase|nr:glycerophosphoryl diester phosphodiesterase [Nocardioidaceae bacterium]
MHYPKGRPQVVAHRGASASHAEHTLGAYVKALDEGADGLECDVRLSADGHLVCVHDRRVDRTTNARGVVSTMTLAELDRLDASYWQNQWAELDDEADEVELDHTKVLTLRRLCEVVRDYDRPIDVAIETKHPTRYGGLVERRLVQLLGEFGWADARSPARVMSFSGVALTRVRRLAPQLEVVLLIKSGTAWKVTKGMLGPGWIAGPDVRELRDRPKLARRLLAGGHRIHSWTVNSEADLELCLDLGVQAVITDMPAYIRSMVHDT